MVNLLIFEVDGHGRNGLICNVKKLMMCLVARHKDKPKTILRKEGRPSTHGETRFWIIYSQKQKTVA